MDVLCHPLHKRFHHRLFLSFLRFHPDTLWYMCHRLKPSCLQSSGLRVTIPEPFSEYRQHLRHKRFLFRPPEKYILPVQLRLLSCYVFCLICSYSLPPQKTDRRYATPKMPVCNVLYLSSSHSSFKVSRSNILPRDNLTLTLLSEIFRISPISLTL